MVRHPDSTSRLIARCAAVALALGLIGAPSSALAADAAVDEYSLGSAGAENVITTDTQVAEPGDVPVNRSAGVVGEEVPAQSQLDAAGSMATPATWIVLGILVVLGGLALVRIPRRRASA